MAEFSIDRFVELYAERAAGMSASEVRALFAVASRPEIVSFAGGMPYVQALPSEDVLAVVADALERPRLRRSCSTPAARDTCRSANG